MLLYQLLTCCKEGICFFTAVTCENNETSSSLVLIEGEAALSLLSHWFVSYFIDPNHVIYPVALFALVTFLATVQGFVYMSYTWLVFLKSLVLLAKIPTSSLQLCSIVSVLLFCGD